MTGLLKKSLRTAVGMSEAFLLCLVLSETIAAHGKPSATFFPDDAMYC
jgi:hypothetical protein